MSHTQAVIVIAGAFGVAMVVLVAVVIRRQEKRRAHQSWCNLALYGKDNICNCRPAAS